jgi:Phenazine biosynthesis-like protein
MTTAAAAETELHHVGKDDGDNQLPMFIVDAFTDRPFAGNPAAVCLVDARRVAFLSDTLERMCNVKLK